MDIADTSFEDVETSFTKELEERRLLRGKKSDLQMRRLRHNIAPTPSSTASTDIFSEGSKAMMWSSKSEEELEDGEQFLDDFAEFQNKKNNFDVAVKTHFRLRPKSSSPTRRSNEFAEQFRNLVNIDEAPMRENRQFGLRQPKSMMNLNTRPAYQNKVENGVPGSNYNYNSRLKSSISSGNLRRSSSRNSVRFKQSMPNLMEFKSPILEGGDESDDEFANDTVVRTTNRLTKFEEKPEESDYNNLVFDESVIQPRFLRKSSSQKSPFRMSSDMYNIENQDELLMPQLHKRTSQWNRPDHLGPFIEQSRKPSFGKSKIKTIKQQIDHNTPIKKGNMYYNPQTMKWEGNQKELEKFNEIDTFESNPVLIKNRINSTSTEKLENIKLRSNSNNPKVVGSMVFDEKNLRWVSVHEDDPDPFENVKEFTFTENEIEKVPYFRTQSQTSPSRETNFGKFQERRYNTFSGVKSIKTTTSTFTINSTFREKFYHEENRWNSKVGSWFVLGNCGANSKLAPAAKNISLTSNENKDYMYEIRKMVLNSTRS